MKGIKIVQTNQVIEVYEYSNLNLTSNSGGNVGEHTEETKEENYDRTIRNRRDNVRRLVTQNFDCVGSKFVTLTFKDSDKFDIKDVQQCDYEFKKFIMRLKRWMDKNVPWQTLKYVAVIEFQDKNKRGAVHYHMICNLPFIAKRELQNLWSNGFVKINSIDKVDNLGAYVIKYMTKEKADNRLKGFKGYLASQNLIKPKVLKSWTSDMNEYVAASQTLSLLTQKKPVYEKTNITEHQTITYKQYNLTRDKKQQNGYKVTTLGEVIGIKKDKYGISEDF